VKPKGDRIYPIAWVWLAAYCLAYVGARTSRVPGLFAVSQVIFLLPVFGAAFLTLEAYRIGPRGDERRVWGLLSLSAWLLTASEGYYSWYQLAVDPAGPTSPSYSDWLNLTAAGVFLLFLAIASGMARRKIIVRLRFLVDAAAAMVLSLMVLFRLWSLSLGGHEGSLLAVRWAIYSFFGIAMLGTVIWLGFGLRKVMTSGRLRNLLVGTSVGVFATGIILAPFVLGSSSAAPGRGWTSALSGMFYLIGYGLMVMAAALRIRDRREPWQSIMSRPPGPESELTTGIMSLCVLLAVFLAGFWAFNSSNREEGTVYFLLGLMATLAMVARTALLSIETDVLRDSAGRDPVTGVGNLVSFEERLATSVTVSHRSREAFVLAILDMDDFTRVNDVLGRSGGDGVLARLGEALQTAAGKRGEVFRIGEDVFAVIVPGHDDHDCMLMGTQLLTAVTTVGLGHGLRLSASVGVVSCDCETLDGSELSRKADAAQVWAKYHGKGRVVVHDDRIVRALGAEERLRLSDERLHYDVARALAASADARDSRSVYHSRNVAALSVLLGEAIGLKEEQLRALEIASMLHDVGQIALPDELVTGPFNPSRRTAAREHAVLGAQLVESVGVDGVAAAVRGHHERWDGGGYPDGLAGEEIPIESRIIALADAYDGMTSGRRSGTVMSRAAALQEIDHGLGTRFDPTLAEEFIRLVGTTSSLGWSDEWLVRG